LALAGGSFFWLFEEAVGCWLVLTFKQKFSSVFSDTKQQKQGEQPMQQKTA